MSFPAISLRSFLASAKRTLQNAIVKQERVTFVVGNESADLDSITSSIVFAYLHSQSKPTSESLYVPLLNIPRADVNIRAELLKLLPYADVEPDHLITLDDLPPIQESRDRLKPENTRWVLVDHNALQGSLGEIYASRVVGCIDHHVEENKVPKDITDEPRVIKPTGSCTSLIVNHFRDSWDKLSQSVSETNISQGESDNAPDNGDPPVRKTWDAQIAKFALASILIDTSDLKPNDKATEDDEEAVRYLEAKIDIAAKSAGKFDRRAFYKQINKAKRDTEGLDVNDLLRKDYKQWSENGVNIGISSVVQSLSYMLSRADSSQNATEAFLGELKSFAKHRDLGLFVIMTKSKSLSGERQKELLLLENKSSTKSVADKFESSTQAELDLEPWKVQSLAADGEILKVWWQRNVDKTRKQVAPMLREIAKA